MSDWWLERDNHGADDQRECWLARLPLRERQRIEDEEQAIREAELEAEEEEADECEAN